MEKQETPRQVTVTQEAILRAIRERQEALAREEQAVPTAA